MTEQEMIRLASENYAKMNLQDKLNESIAETVLEINNILELEGIEDRIKNDDISFNLNTLTDKLIPIRTGNGLMIKRKRRLSDIIFNHYSGELPITNFYHYTSFSSFENMLRTKEVWLYSMVKRFSQEEYISFYIDHDVDGSIQALDARVALNKRLLSDTFYMSFARAAEITRDVEDDLWRSFGDDGLGVRLEFEVKAKYTDFRNVHYNDPSRQKSELLFNKLRERIRKLYDKELVFAGLSKIGCFYLKGDFDTEHETRLLIRKNADEYDFDYEIHSDHNNVPFIKLGFQNQMADLKILSIQPGHLINGKDVSVVLDKYPLDIRPTVKNKADFSF